MPISQKQLSLTDITAHPIAHAHVEYVRARTQSRLHQLVLNEFVRQEDLGLTQAELARRTGKRTEVISRLLGAPGNWTMNTASDLLLGMGAELVFSTNRLFPMHVVGVYSVEAKQPTVFLGEEQDAPVDTNLNRLLFKGDPNQIYPLERADRTDLTGQTNTRRFPQPYMEEQ